MSETLSLTFKGSLSHFRACNYSMQQRKHFYTLPSSTQACNVLPKWFTAVNGAAAAQNDPRRPWVSPISSALYAGIQETRDDCFQITGAFIHMRNNEWMDDLWKESLKETHWVLF